jgi:hypothetical protein
MREDDRIAALALRPLLVLTCVLQHSTGQFCCGQPGRDRDERANEVGFPTWEGLRKCGRACGLCVTCCGFPWPLTSVDLAVGEVASLLYL